jgi:hypothetical protein
MRGNPQWDGPNGLKTLPDGHEHLTETAIFVPGLGVIDARSCVESFGARTRTRDGSYRSVRR